jgi:hypothetical protein
MFATAAVIGALAACEHPPHFGHIALHVTLPEPDRLEAVDYDITGGGLREIKGRIETGGPQATFSKLISHVPIGEGYVIRVDGKSSDGKLTCAGMTTADVKLNQTTVVNLMLTCKNAGDGEVHIVVGVACPGFQITSYAVSPLVASIGGVIEVGAETSDPDGGTTSFMWTAPTGVFANAASAQTTYTCTTAGDVALIATATWGPCDDSKTVTVTCLPPDAGRD